MENKSLDRLNEKLHRVETVAERNFYSNYEISSTYSNDEEDKENRNAYSCEVSCNLSKSGTENSDRIQQETTKYDLINHPSQASNSNQNSNFSNIVENSSDASFSEKLYERLKHHFESNSLLPNTSGQIDLKNPNLDDEPPEPNYANLVNLMKSSILEDRKVK